MSLSKTNLVIVASQLPPDLEADPQEFFEAMVERMEIQSPVGTNFFVVGDIEPSSNSGPWLKGGTQWWVFDVNTGRYIPLDISASAAKLFVVGPDNPGTPGASDPTLWLRTAGTRAVGWYGWDGTVWRSFNGQPNSGSTAERPTGPIDLEQYWDTDINSLIHFERAQWRTVSGTPGDVKFVTDTVLDTALTKNPGWGLLNESDESKRGRVIAQASKDPGGAPASSVTVPTGITQTAAGDVKGEETHVNADNEIPQHTHLFGHMTTLSTSADMEIFMAQGAGDPGELEVPLPLPPNYFTGNLASGGTNAYHTGTGYLDPSNPLKPHRDGPVGTMLITSVQLSKANAADYTTDSVAHNNIQPTVFMWTLVKL